MYFLRIILLPFPLDAAVLNDRAGCWCSLCNHFIWWLRRCCGVFFTKTPATQQQQPNPISSFKRHIFWLPFRVRPIEALAKLFRTIRFVFWIRRGRWHWMTGKCPICHLWKHVEGFIYLSSPGQLQWRHFRVFRMLEWLAGTVFVHSYKGKILCLQRTKKRPTLLKANGNNSLYLCAVLFISLRWSDSLYSWNFITLYKHFEETRENVLWDGGGEPKAAWPQVECRKSHTYIGMRAAESVIFNADGEAAQWKNTNKNSLCTNPEYVVSASYS